MYVNEKPVAESGFVILKDNSAIIHGLETVPYERGKGYASMVVQKGIKILKDMGIGKVKSRVSKQNEGSIILHKRNVFNIDNENESAYFFGKEI